LECAIILKKASRAENALESHATLGLPLDLIGQLAVGIA